MCVCVYEHVDLREAATCCAQINLKEIPRGMKHEI